VILFLELVKKFLYKNLLGKISVLRICLRDRRARLEAESLSWATAFPAIVSNLSALEKFEINCLGCFPSPVHIFRILGTHCPNLKHLSLICGAYTPCENFSRLFEDVFFLSESQVSAVHKSRSRRRRRFHRCSRAHPSASGSGHLRVP